MALAKFMGVEVVEKTTDKDVDKRVLKVGNKEYWGIVDTKLAEHGIENGSVVRKAMKQVDRDLTMESMVYTGKEVVRTKKTCTLELGSGDGSMICTTTAKRTSPNPKATAENGESPTLETFGSFSRTKKVSKLGDKEFVAKHQELKEAIKASVEKKSK